MGVTIKKVYELSDDLQEILIGEPAVHIEYTEVYPNETVVNGLKRMVYILRPKTIYDIELAHFPKQMNFILDFNLSLSGLMYNYNPITQHIIVYI